MIGFVSGLLVSVVGVAFPAYASFKAIETDDKEDDTQWLTYWVIFAAFQLSEALTDIFVSWFPFYYELKLGFLVALQLPQYKLANKLYVEYLRKFLVEHEAAIDAGIKEFQERGTDYLKEKGAVVAAKAQEAIQQGIQQGTAAATKAAADQAAAATKAATAASTAATDAAGDAAAAAASDAAKKAE